MPKNRTLQRLRRFAVYCGARLVQAIAHVLPLDSAIAFGGWMGKAAFSILGSEREKTLHHLTMAFGKEKPEAERREIGRRVFMNAGRDLAEFMLFPRWTDERLRARIHFDHPEPLLEASRLGRGVVILGAHFGNWELMGAYAARVLGMNFGVIARRLSNPYLDQMVNAYRQRAGVKVFPRGERAMSLVRHLRTGGALAILGDHDMRKVKGTFVDFFGRPANTATGPAELIIRSGAQWFIIVPERLPDGCSHCLHCEGPLPVPDGEDHNAKVRRLTEEFTHRIEEFIRRHPDQWMWMHNRWRKKPKKGNG